jgi:hypothetical protein
MTTMHALQEEFANIGYVAIARDYVFSDIFSATTPNRQQAPCVVSLGERGGAWRPMRFCMSRSPDHC